jgi:hypothetical protein
MKWKIIDLLAYKIQIMHNSETTFSNKISIGLSSFIIICIVVLFYFMGMEIFLQEKPILRSGIQFI